MPKGSDNAGNQPRKRGPVLAEEQYAELNHLLFASEPAALLRQRLDALAAWYAGPPEVDVVDFGGFRYKMGDPEAPELREARASVELISILHLGIETLFRLLFISMTKPKCPWLEIVSLRDHSAFKAFIAKVADDQWRDNIEESLLGGERHPSVSQAEWDDAVEGYSSFIQIAAHAFLDEGDLYNASKHGMAAIAQNIGKASLDGLPLFEGQGVVNLKRRGGVPKTLPEAQRWSIEVRPIGMAYRFGLSSLTHIALESVWSILRGRYLGTPVRTSLIPKDLVYAVQLSHPSVSQGVSGGVDYALPTKEKGAPWGSLLPAHLTINGISIDEVAFEAGERWASRPSALTSIERPGSGSLRAPSLAEGVSLLPVTPG